MTEEKTFVYQNEDVMDYVKRMAEKRNGLPLKERIAIAELTQEKSSQDKYVKMILSR